VGPAGAFRTEQLRFEIEFTMSLRPPEASNGECWRNLFRNPVVVQGDPVAKRIQKTPGLEVPLNAMTALIGTQKATLFDDRVFIKGFSSMLVLTGRNEDSFLWHHVYQANGSRVSYLDHGTDFTETVTASDMQSARHIVGWCSEAKIFAGL